jgi:hypothetical protein
MRSPGPAWRRSPAGRCAGLIVASNCPPRGGLSPRSTPSAGPPPLPTPAAGRGGPRARQVLARARLLCFPGGSTVRGTRWVVRRVYRRGKQSKVRPGRVQCGCGWGARSRGPAGRAVDVAEPRCHRTGRPAVSTRNPIMARSRAWASAVASSATSRSAWPARCRRGTRGPGGPRPRDRRRRRPTPRRTAPGARRLEVGHHRAADARR